MSQKLPLNKVEWNEDTSQFNEDFIKNYNEERWKYNLKLMFNIPRNYMDFIMIYLSFLPETMKIEKVKKACD